jgi:DNA-binding XRE family transcriptional regulator
MERKPDPWKEPTEFIERVEQLRVRGESIVGRRPPGERELAILRERLLQHKTLGQIARVHGFLTNERPRQLLNAYFGVKGRPPDKWVRERELAKLGAALRAERERQGMSQAALSRASGLHRATISKIERGQEEPRFDTLMKLRDGLGSLARVFADAERGDELGR